MDVGIPSYPFLKIGMSVLHSLGNLPGFHVFFNHQCLLDFVCLFEYII